MPHLRHILSFDDLHDDLEDELDWNLSGYSFEEPTFEYEAGELGFDTSLLSQGTLGSLALATRRAAAIQAIGTFAENHQILVFTCHPDHAEALQNHVGAKTLRVAE